MATRGKEKDMEKGLSTPERTPKYWTQSWVDPVQAGWWLVLDGSEWPCAVLDVRIVIDEYPGSDQDRGKAKQP
ncbi:hypothetical protein Bca52824_011513 [Brassica carinata]|uniref:Uncharacterized protein n=1 Tax=Brassica carinata TaxID=52824 RepID=A0A8X7WH97_BRACI|nr:hypothetical protein Bca52824_011513 [Brassica carinata]